MATKIGENQYVGNMNAFSCGDEGYGSTSVPVETGVNQLGETVYSCQDISGLFSGGLWDTWLGEWIESQASDDIDRIYRMEEAQAFQELLEGIENGTKDWRDLQAFEFDFLAEKPEMVEYYDRLLERVTYNGLLQDMENAKNPEDWQTIFDEYGAAGIEDNSYISENGLGFINPQQVLDSLILGDADWGVTVQICSSTVTTNCVDPTAINDIWEDFGRHIQVIFKGLEIPGLPDWLPLPGIMRLPTIGEIWDTISGPFNEAARDQLNECMAGEDGVVGTNPNTGINDDKLASVCYEERDIAGIITQGILNGAGDIVDATTDAVGGMVDKALEGVDCVLNPKVCAGKIKDVIDGILGGADPTQPGLPDWMRVIIVGSQYGDDILKELEDIFNTDINGDGTIGLVPEPEECGEGEADFGNGCEPVCPENPNIPASSEQCVPATPEFGYCQDGVTEKADAEGTNCQEYAPNGFCEDGATKKDNPEGTNCEEYEPPLSAEEQQCNEQGRVFNDITGECEETCANPEHVVGADGSCGPPETGTMPKQGDPCDSNGDGQLDGTLQPVQSLGFGPSSASGELECVPNQTEPTETGFDCNQPRPDGGFGAQSWDRYCAATRCLDGSIKDNPEGTNCPEYVAPEVTQPEETSPECDQQDRVTNPDGSCGECKPGFTPDPEGFDQCIQAPPECNDCSCAEYAAANPAECTTCPEGESYCESTGQCEAEGDCPAAEEAEEGSAGGGGGGGGGGGMLTGEPLDLGFDIAGDPTLLARTEFPITNYLAGIFTNSNGGRNV